MESKKPPTNQPGNCEVRHQCNLQNQHQKLTEPQFQYPPLRSFDLGPHFQWLTKYIESITINLNLLQIIIWLLFKCCIYIHNNFSLDYICNFYKILDVSLLQIIVWFLFWCCVYIHNIFSFFIYVIFKRFWMWFVTSHLSGTYFNS